MDASGTDIAIEPKPASANALERGRFYREAAILYRDHLKNPLKAAQCLENGGLIAEAVVIYEDLKQFDELLGCAKTVFPYVENHNFYVEHWAHSVLWRKMRDLGRVLQAAGFIGEADDVFMFRRNELSDVLWSVIVIAHRLDIDLPAAFVRTMDDIASAIDGPR